MKGVLIYDAAGIKRNGKFIDKLIRYADEFGMNLQLITYSSNDVSILTNADFAVVRVIAPELTQKLESLGIRVFNNYLTSFVANNKWQTYLFCKRLGAPVMETQLGISGVQPQTFPYILKSCNGHGGSEVFMVKDRAEFIKTDEYFRSVGKEYVEQRPCTDLGKDMRLYVLGGKVVASMLRYNASDFKSNYSLGGSASAVEPSAQQLKIARQICSALNCDYVGIDFILDNGKWVVNEIEDVVGARMLYENTDIDIAKQFMLYIKSVFSR